MPESNPSFLHSKYRDLHTSPEVESIAKRTQTKIGEKVSSKPTDRIQNYLDYLTDSLGLPDDTRNPETHPHRFKADDHTREEKLAHFKQSLYNSYVIKPSAVPESYFATQRRIAREQGHGDVDITDEIKRQLTEVIITDQKSSLDNWIDYLSSPDATYPDWLKYWTMRSILGMGAYDKEKKAFDKRRKDTTKPFPDIDREALAYVLDEMQKKHSGLRERVYGPLLEDEQQLEDLLKQESFAKLYAWAIEKVTPVSKEQLANIKGEWIRYPKGSNHTPLVQSLQGHGTGWCTAGESTAEIQLKTGDFYVYYSYDVKGKPTIPRVAIRMQNNQVAEVRGIGADQNLDPYIGKVVQDKLVEFPDGKAYEKKSQDMKHLTEIEHKMRLGKELTKDDLIFLYEINGSIEGFGYQRDPRIDELRSQRDPKADAPVVFACEPNEIAWSQTEITENTKAYIGKLFPGIFGQLGHLEHLYISFPESKIRRDAVEIDNKKTPKEYLAELKKQGFKVSDFAKYIVEHMREQVEEVAQLSLATKVKGVFGKGKKETKQAEQVDLVCLTVKDLGFAQGATADQIYAKAAEFGLELCPPDVGPQYRVQYANQPMNEYLCVAMKQISDPGGHPSIFNLKRDEDGAGLARSYARPDRRWVPDRRFVFRLSSLRK